MSMPAFEAFQATMSFKDNRGYAMTHELMHSFIASDALMRNTSLRSMNAYLDVISKSKQPIAPQDFALQMKMNAIEIYGDIEFFKSL